MPVYYVNKKAQDNGDHEVHEAGCSYMPEDENRKFLGSFKLHWSKYSNNQEYESR